MAGDYFDIVGTLNSSFQVGLTGNIMKNVAAGIEMRNPTDTGFSSFFLKNLGVEGYQEFSELVANPPNPPTGKARLFVKNDQSIYLLDSSGTVTNVSESTAPDVQTQLDALLTFTGQSTISDNSPTYTQQNNILMVS